jgi:hypothetical protein
MEQPTPFDFSVHELKVTLNLLCTPFLCVYLFQPGQRPLPGDMRGLAGGITLRCTNPMGRSPVPCALTDASGRQTSSAS